MRRASEHSASGFRIRGRFRLAEQNRTANEMDGGEDVHRGARLERGVHAEREEGRKCKMISQSVPMATFRFSIESQIVSLLICDVRKWLPETL